MTTDSEQSVKTLECERIGVCGAGTMGAGIAIVCARAGFRTVLYDIDQTTLDRAFEQIQRFFDSSVQRGKLDSRERDECVGRLTLSPDIVGLADADLIIEAVYEDLAIKRKLLSELDSVCAAHAIFASNTSTLSITEIAAGCGRESHVVGMHFCLPAPLMRLVEMAPGINTDEREFERAVEICKALGQLPTRTLDTPGFILNYFLVPFNNDVIRLIEADVAAPADIDRALKVAMGYKMGPCELLDLVGLDTQILLCDAFFAMTHNERASAPALLKRMVAAGRVGRKSERGFYRHDGGAMFGADVSRRSTADANTNDSISAASQPPSYRIVDVTGSLSFNQHHALFDNAHGSPLSLDEALDQAAMLASVDMVLVIGDCRRHDIDELVTAASNATVVVELSSECLGVHTGLSHGSETERVGVGRVLGFSRFRLGDEPISSLVELVQQADTHKDAIDTARRVFEAAELSVSLCRDRPGRILDRLLCPYFNDVLERLDDGLASAEDMDQTLRLGLGYPEGPVALLARSGLHHHAAVSERLFDAYGQRAFVPARRAAIARERYENRQDKRSN